MPHRKSSESRSVRAVPRKSMGNIGKAKIVAKIQAQPSPTETQSVEMVPVVEPESDMIICDLFPEGLVEKPIAFHRRDALRPVCKDCDNCKSVN